MAERLNFSWSGFGVLMWFVVVGLCGFVLEGKWGVVCCSLEEGEQTERGGLVYHTNFQKIATDTA
jgi:hypothetical protein